MNKEILEARTRHRSKKIKELWEYCEKFIVDNRLDITKEFSEMPATAVKLMEEICEMVGYYEEDCE